MSGPDDELVRRFLAEPLTLDDGELARLGAGLADDAELRRSLHVHLLTAELLSAALSPERADFRNRVATAWRPASSASGFARRVAGAARARSRQRRWPRWLAVAACLAALFAGWQAWPAMHAIGALAQSAGAVAVQRDGRSLPGGDGLTLLAGDLIDLGGGAATIRFRDGTSLALSRNAHAELIDGQSPVGGGAKRIRLDRGRVDAEVQPQPRGNPLIIATAHAEVVVVGTVFTVDAAAEATQLTVVSGLVRLAPAAAPAVEVAAGYAATTAGGPAVLSATGGALIATGGEAGTTGALGSAAGRGFHVAVDGDDGGPGSAQRPFRTIDHAAQLAQAGDSVTVHAGTYREWVRPPRGGESESARITYRAAAGERVEITGAERVTGWTSQGGGCWSRDLPDAFFRGYNPYALRLSGTAMTYGDWHHRGDVHLDDEALVERRTADEVKAAGGWCCERVGGSTRITANFAAADPNQRRAEINVRECVFFPELPGLAFITVDGFVIRRSAENWSSAGTATPQNGAIGPRLGAHWTIENCVIEDARCTGISLGNASGVGHRDLARIGHHLIRNNLVRRCGQNGIAGMFGAGMSEISGNLVEDINQRKEFGGWETAGIKLHSTIDTVISDNCVRRVFKDGAGPASGIWLWASQGARISGNVVCETGAPAVHLEGNHGPTLIDNNVIIGNGEIAAQHDAASVWTHNLFVDFRAGFYDDPHPVEVFAPHSLRPGGPQPVSDRDQRWFNNIFVGGGLDALRDGPGNAADGNLYLRGAAKSRFDAHGVVSARDPQPRLVSDAAGVRLVISTGAATERPGCALITSDLIGALGPTGQRLGDRNGAPVTIDRDFFGAPRAAAPAPGPFAAPAPGSVQYQLWPKSGGRERAPAR